MRFPAPAATVCVHHDDHDLRRLGEQAGSAVRVEISGRFDKGNRDGEEDQIGLQPRADDCHYGYHHFVFHAVSFFVVVVVIVIRWLTGLSKIIHFRDEIHISELINGKSYTRTVMQLCIVKMHAHRPIMAN